MVTSEIGKKYGMLTIIEKTDKRYRWVTIYKCCCCDCGNEHISTTGLLTSAGVTSCGCRNKENQENIRNLDRGLVDGTMKAGIKADRKVNKNSSSGITGVHWDKQRNKWVAQITFQRQNHLLGRFKSKEEAVRARKEAEEFYFGKYRNQAKK